MQPNQEQIKFRNTRSRFYKPQQSYQQKDFTDKNNSTSNTSAYWKDKGNQQFKNKNYEKAIIHYTQAISINQNESIYYSNRALCYHLKKQYDLSIKDVKTALDIQPTNLKAHYIYGRSLAEKSKIDSKNIDNAIQRLRKAFSLCKSQKKLQFEQQISLAIFRAKKLKWYINYTNQIQYIQNLLEKLEKQLGKNLSEITKLRVYLKQKKQKFVIPDYLKCKITLEIMQDPVITQAGITYERAAIEDHFKNKSTDPYTNQQISPKITPNKAIKNCIQQFLQNNPWSFQFNQNQDWKSITF